MKRLKQFVRLVIRATIPLRVYKIYSKNPQVLECHKFPQRTHAKYLCIFASYSGKGHVEEYVFNYLSTLVNCGFDIAFVTTSERLTLADLDKLSMLCVRVIRRKNVGYDFGSWKAGLFHANISLDTYERVLLTNDSYYAPLFPLTEALAKVNSDIFGITDSFEIQYHMMSYFVLYSKRILNSVSFMNQWKDVRMIPTRLKTLVIYLYEVGMSQKFQRKGFTIAAYCGVKDLCNYIGNPQIPLSRINTVHRYWKELIEKMRCPILKVDIFWRFLTPQGDESWREVVRKTGYDENLILYHQQNKRT